MVRTLKRRRSLRRPRPYRRRSYKKRSFSRRRRRISGRRRLYGARFMSTVPRAIRTALKFSKAYPVSGDGTAWIVNGGQFRTNSIWDPDYTSITGFSAIPRPWWAKAYDYYKVYACKYAVVAELINENYTTPLQLTVWNTNSIPTLATTNPSDPEYQRSDPQMRHRIFQINPGGLGKKKIIKGWAIPYKIWGQTKLQHAVDPNFEALTNANPVNQCILTCMISSTDKTAVPANDLVRMTVYLKYYVKFYRRFASLYQQLDA